MTKYKMSLFTTSVNYIIRNGKMFLEIPVPQTMPIEITMKACGQLEREFINHVITGGGATAGEIATNEGVACGVGTVGKGACTGVGAGITSTLTAAVASCPQHSERIR